ncbi:MAG: preprotein translocase subunit SecE [Candidatus Hydrogenedentes bacterium]|nr:preprotein translocase subunit SecE [Candidatus Hydrogenedentota bacterium]
MAKQIAAVAKPSLVTRVREFYQEVVTELGKVAWPTKAELKSNTTIVLCTLILLGVVVGIYDFVFLKFIQLLIWLV